MASEIDPELPPASRPIGRFMLQGGLWVSAAQVLGAGCATASQLLLARLLVPEALGAFYLVQSVVVPAAQMAQLGMVRPTTRLVAEARARGEETSGVLRSSLVLAAGAGLVVGLLYLGLGGWLARRVFAVPLMEQGMLLAAVWTLAISFQQITAAALRGLYRVGAAAFVAEAGAKILMAGALAALLWASAGPREFPTVLSVAVASAGVMALLGLGMLAPQVFSGSARSAYRPMLRASLPLVVTGVVEVALMWADLWVAGVLFSPEEVALYGAAKRLVVFVGLPLMVLPLVIQPVIVDLHAQGDRERLERVVRAATTLTGLPAIGMLALFALASEPALGLAFGDFYRGASTILLLLCLERLVFVWVGPCGLTLLMTGHETAVMKISVSMGIATVVLVYAGALWHGLVGVAIGFTLGSAIQQLLAWQTVRRRVGIRTSVSLGHLPDALGAVRRNLRR